eukprot:TRINITY_DN76178_c0_g1_i1.p1 TRINITY_DN76178_c0_g1~~TRINITY_DN76178_c0_g1_i1.p1  ORF type:complete len:664 (-),score=79.20 TRINITY_DN76178_c0_g1_i1:16-1980(-)
MGVLLWRVCGGGEQGGLLVRESAGLGSELLDGRLSTDALIQELARRTVLIKGKPTQVRVHYKLLEGEGPQSGWITARMKDRDLLIPAAGQSPLQELKRSDLRPSGNEKAKSSSRQHAPKKLGSDESAETSRNNENLRYAVNQETSQNLVTHEKPINTASLEAPKKLNTLEAAKISDSTQTPKNLASLESPKASVGFETAKNLASKSSTELDAGRPLANKETPEKSISAETVKTTPATPATTRSHDTFKNLESQGVVAGTSQSSASRAPPPGVIEDSHLQNHRFLDSSVQRRWNALERSLYLCDGKWNPETLASLRRTPISASERVSVVTPTSEKRAKFHEQLWKCFSAQTWPDKELVVVESHRGQGSSFLRQIAETHSNVVYVSLRRQISIGCKRNLGAYLASGSVIACFDDDDIYAPNYISTMVSHLRSKNLIAVTLSSWYDYDTRLGACGFVDPQALNDMDLVHGRQYTFMKQLRDSAVESAVYGYGFSYVYTRDAIMLRPYPDMNSCEDIFWMLQLRDAVGRVGLLRDTAGICLHLIHGGNTADSVMHRGVAPETMASLEVAKLQFVKPMVERCQLVSSLDDRKQGRFFVGASSPSAMRAMTSELNRYLNGVTSGSLGFDRGGGGGGMMGGGMMVPVKSSDFMNERRWNFF